MEYHVERQEILNIIIQLNESIQSFFSCFYFAHMNYEDMTIEEIFQKLDDIVNKVNACKKEIKQRKLPKVELKEPKARLKFLRRKGDRSVS